VITEMMLDATIEAMQCEGFSNEEIAEGLEWLIDEGIIQLVDEQEGEPAA
jgi:hypothetical protein